MSDDDGIDGRLFGRDLFGVPMKPTPGGVVAERFTMPPFTILDSKQGDWQERKRAWIGLGIQGEKGRDAKAYNIDSWKESKGQLVVCPESGGTSIFDPVLCELVYRWFTHKGGQVIDPFAGGSVRGIVATSLGRHYHGIELREEQVAANIAQAGLIGVVDPAPVWRVGDAIDFLPSAPEADLVFACPPYGDLEVYSDNPKDLSAMGWSAFLTAYREIIKLSVARMKPDSFACFVVGDFRDPKGAYRNFPGLTVQAFLDAGIPLYNEAILATSIGSAALRVSKQFITSRKLAKVHQNIYVFAKGDPRKAAARCEVVLE